MIETWLKPVFFGCADTSQVPSVSEPFLVWITSRDGVSVGFIFYSGSFLKADVKKSGAPKFPLLRARAKGWLPRLKVHGTPGSIVGPMRRARTPRRSTAALEVSPPARIKRRTPALTNP